MSTTLSWAQAPQAVLFDLDGTLADTAGDLAGALNRVRARDGLAPQPLSLLRPWASAGARGLLAAGMDIHPDHPEYEAYRQAFLDAYLECLAETTCLFEGMEAVLQDIESRSMKWGVVTNKPHKFTVPVMAGLGLSERAGVIISGDTTAHAKPHPLPLLTACEQLGVSPAATLYVGDDLRDIQAAKAAHMPSAAAAWGYLGHGTDIRVWQADVITDTPLDLIRCWA
ncbi:MAG: HAD-IA family hydrolase [Aquabacterium sp.]